MEGAKIDNAKRKTNASPRMTKVAKSSNTDQEKVKSDLSKDAGECSCSAKLQRYF